MMDYKNALLTLLTVGIFCFALDYSLDNAHEHHTQLHNANIAKIEAAITLLQP